MPDGRFDPFHRAHAIEQVYVSIGLSRALTHEEFGHPLWQEFRSAVKDALPISQDEQGARVEMLPLGGQRFVPGLAARTYRRSRPDGVDALHLRVEPQTVTFLNSVYTRWAAVREETWEIYQNLLETCVFPWGINIQSIGLGYIDRFLWNGDPNEMRGSFLLKPGTQWLPDQFLKQEFNWHSHSGYFDRADAQTRRLTIVNLDATTGIDQVNRSISVAINMSDALGQPTFEPPSFSNPGESLAWAKHRLEILHNENKRLMHDLLKDDMAERIDLKVPNDAI